jgi:integrase
MTNTTLSARDRAREHLQAALDTGVRGEVRDLVRKALAAASGKNLPVITDVTIRGAAVGARILDPACPGLLMKAGARTGKRWFFRTEGPPEHPQAGKQVEVLIGAYPAIGLARAREYWSVMRAERAAGQMPRSPTDTSTGRHEITIGGLVDRYAEEFAGKKRSGAEDERMLRHHLAPYAARLAREFTIDDAEAVLEPIIARGTTRQAQKVRAVMAQLFNFASGKRRGKLRYHNFNRRLLPRDHRNPVEATDKPGHEATSYCPTPAELRAYAQGLEKVPAPYSPILRLQALTMTRVGEVCGARWDEIDLAGGRWTIPGARMKNGRPHVVMLSWQAADLLTGLADATASDYVFPARTDKTKPINKLMVIRALAVRRSALGVSDRFTSHGLRHAALTWAAEKLCPIEVRDRLSSHTTANTGADRIYTASAALNAPAAEWWQRWADHLDLLAAGNVVEIGARA